MYQQYLPDPNSSIDLDVVIISPTNYQEVGSSCEVVGRAVSLENLIMAEVYAATIAGDATNRTNILISGTNAEIRTGLKMNSTYNFVWIKAVNQKGTFDISPVKLVIADLSLTNSEPTNTNTNTNTNIITVDTNAPVLIIDSPTNYQNVGKSYTIAGTVGDETAGVSVYHKINEDSYSTVTVQDGSWSKQITLSATGWNTNFVYAVDIYTNVSATNQLIVFYEEGLPSVTIDSPVGGTKTKSATIDVSGTAEVDAPAVIQSVQLSLNGGAYQNVGNTTWSYTGLILSEGSNTVQAMSTADNGKSAYSSIVTVIKDSTAPTVSVTSPQDNRVYSNQLTLTVSGTASDQYAGVSNVYVALDSGAFQQATGTAVWSKSVTASSYGMHTIKVYAIDKLGNVSTTNQISISMIEVELPFTVYFKKPDSWSTPISVHYWGGDCGSTTWNGDDMTDDGNGWWSFIFSGTTTSLIFNDGSHQTVDLTRDKMGWYIYQDKWYDSNPDDNEPPTVSIISPADGYSGSGTISLIADASDNNGVSSVEFYADGNEIGSVNVSPWVYNWNSALIGNGTHNVYATAYDEAGNSNASGIIHITTANTNLYPIADAGPDKTVIISNSVQFDASASYDPNGTIVSYSWDNGLSGVNPSKAYYQMGTYTVTLTVTDNDGATDTDTVTITVSTNVPSPERLDFREETIYFIITTRFYDGDPANNRYTRACYNSGNYANNDPAWRGDFKGLIEKLPYIKALGFTAIWITPPVLNRSDCDYHGYHAWDMSEIDGRLESAGATYQDFINAAHAMDMKVIQDIVLNHSCKYGEKNLGGRILWGDSEDEDWGADGPADYYDVYNASFEYDGVSIEPLSGKNYYIGDVYQSTQPTAAQLPWLYDGDDSEYLPYADVGKSKADLVPHLESWGAFAGFYSSEGYECKTFQWSEHAYSLLNPEYYHIMNLQNWEDYTCQLGTMHPDCVDLNTESTAVQDYLIDTYTHYIEMGVDAFRIDTTKHISRVMFNRHFVDAFKDAGGDEFYMFGEVLTKVYEIWNKGNAALSAPFYTWKERTTYSAEDWKAAYEGYTYEVGQGTGSQPTSDNHLLWGNDYHTPDYSQKSGLDVIDCHMHVNFSDAGSAFNVRGNDHFYNDATWNVVYVDSHDYGPATSLSRYSGGTDAWAENMSLMWTFRGIPCLYYGSEIEFKAGVDVDGDPNVLALANSGRAYFGDNIEGSVNTTDFGVWDNATGAMATTLNSPLAKHLSRLNRIRLQVPALQKGQYSTENCSGGICFKRRYTDDDTDSFALVAISSGATFSGLPAGTYTDVVTGDTQTISEGGTVTASCSGRGNMRVYVLSTALTPAPGKIGDDGPYLKP